MEAPKTAEGIMAWAVIERCGGQIRMGAQGGGGVILPLAVGLDFGAVLALAEAMGARCNLLVDLLPAVERIVVEAYRAKVSGEG